MKTKATGCFLIGATGNGITKNGTALIGSVSDNPYDIRTFLKYVKAEGTLAHIGTELRSTTNHTLEERGYFARLNETTRGINKAGLAFTCAMVIEDNNQKQLSNPTPFADITEFIMNNCETVIDALEVFSSKKATNPAYSVLLADAKGDLAHIEVGNYGMAINHHYLTNKPGIVFAVNCYLSKTLADYNAPHTAITNKENNNLVRKERGRSFVDSFEGNLNVESFMKLLSDHENSDKDPLTNPILEAWGYSICNHGTRRKETYPAENLPWGTVSAEIMDPSKKQFWYAYGWPCGQKPKYKDQIFQENSWGEFIPFGFKNYSQKEKITPLTTLKGEITPAGLKH